jgi:hypothetical protein
MLLYPEGTQLAGTLFQYEQERTKPEEVRYATSVCDTYLMRIATVYPADLARF